MKPDKVSSVFWIVFSIIIVYSSYKLKIGTLAHPGPGLLPFLSGILLCAVSIKVFLKRGINLPDEKTMRIRQLWQGLNWTKTVIVTFVLLVYALALTHLGFLLSTFLLLIFLFRIIEPMRWFVAIGGAMIACFISFAVFVLWLQVQLPHGIIEKIFF